MGLNAEQKKERSTYLESNLEITECSQRKPYVFISYASDNWETVFKHAVVPMQKQYGLRVYADRAFDKVNDKWIVPMLRNLRGSDMMIAFISQSYIESYACFLELLTAVNSKKQIVFVSLGERLHLGATNDLPPMERGAKTEMINQGSNLSTNTNNTSNDIMRAMKSAYTSLSTLLEQDALSKYDISDAFINFFRDASINQKTINDVGAVRSTIASLSLNVFDESLAVEPVPAVQPVRTDPVRIVDEPKEPVRTAGPADRVYVAEPIEPIRIPEASDFAPGRQPMVQEEEETAFIGEEEETAFFDMSDTVVFNPGEDPPEARSWADEPNIRQNPPVPPPETRKTGLTQRISEAWTNNLPVLGVAGVIIGVLNWLFASTLPMLAVILSFVGLACGIKGLKSGKKLLPIIALILNGFILMFFFGGMFGAILE